ncbi:MAG: ATP-dependent DNA helicase RecG [Candidatus Eisenbacteria bacterium]|nr:ATP-dependent DNA helicase RecG [Candidatus Eisenbacteria bacterium]
MTLEAIDLDAPVHALPGIGPARAKDLAQRGVESVGDLLRFPPREYILPSERRPVAEAEPDHPAVFHVRLESIRLLRRGWRRSTVEAIVADDTGSARSLWFRAPYLARSLKPGVRMLLRGAPTGDPPVFLHPRFEVIRDGEETDFERILPRYPNVPGLPPRTLRRAIRHALDRLPPLDDPLPTGLRRRLGLPALSEAIRSIHRPETREEAERAKRRFIFEELYRLQSIFARARRERLDVSTPRPEPGGEEVLRRFLGALPFPLTEDQARVVEEFRADLASGRPMERLLVGDVGCGKTVVAAAAVAWVAGARGQSAVLAPTEVLARQHRDTLAERFEPLGLRVELLTGDLSAAEKERVRRAARDGDVAILIGTHALLQEPVRFRNLALAVVDEQHRFGVRQRALLPAKGEAVHLLLLSATPIPRSLALTLYGDLDISFIRTMPPGRRPPETRHMEDRGRAEAYRLLRERLDAGEQGFVLFALVEESDTGDRRAAVTAAKRLAEGPFRDYRVGLLHGRLPAAERVETLDRFRGGGLDLLVSTTVIEVGVDLPRATVMIVEDADRFGLSQLHQIRGRVGRSDLASWCFLHTRGELTPQARERLAVIGRETDGFRIAEADLRLRGPGDLLGERQSGRFGFGIADLLRDTDLLEAARREAFARVALDFPENLPRPVRSG